jgi:signal transduction histidine kinase
MQTLVKQGLALARGRDEIGKQRCQTDLHALIDSLVCDYSDAGESLRFSGERGVTILTHPQALRRIMINLIDNSARMSKSPSMRNGRTGSRSPYRTAAPVFPTSI